MKNILFVFLFINFISYAQQKAVKVYSERDDNNGNVTIYANNNSNINYTVAINFSILENTNHGFSNPYLKTISPGISTVLTLKKNEMVKGSIRYKYSYNYRKGCLNTRVDKDIVYLIPTQINRETSIKYINYFGSKYGKELPEGWEVYGFKIKEGDTIFASRKGKVIKIEKTKNIESEHSVYDTKRSSMQILHNDCSFGEYTNIKKFFVKEKDVVLPGQPIGTAKAKLNHEYATLMFSVYYKNINTIGGKLKSKNVYIPLKFDVNGLAEKLYEEKTYQSVHNLETITQEMRKREIKKYKKSLGKWY